MAKHEFLKSLRVARNLFFHQRAQANGSHTADGTASRGDIWLTPRSVRAFDVGDFPELGPDRQRALQTAVRDFLDVATQVPPNEPATPEQIRQARLLFTKILEILAAYFATPQEMDRVEAVLKRLDFPHGYPPWVASWTAELGFDHDDLPEVAFDVYVDERTFPREELGRFSSRLRQQILHALMADGSERHPYVRLHTVVEYKQG